MRNSTKSTMFPLSPFLEFGEVHALSIPHYVIKKGRCHGARHGKTEEQKEYHVAWNVWKRCCQKVDSQGGRFTYVFTIDFSEIQFIVNHNSQSNGQNKCAKRWTNSQKNTYDLSTELERYQGQCHFTLNKSEKWAFETTIRFSSCCFSLRTVSTTSQSNKLQTHFPQ